MGSGSKAISGKSEPLQCYERSCEILGTPPSDSRNVLGRTTDKLLIMWPECQFGIHLVVSKEIEHHPDIQALYAAIRKGNPGTTDHDITRDFTNTFHYSEVGSILDLTVETANPTTRR